MNLEEQIVLEPIYDPEKLKERFEKVFERSLRNLPRDKAQHIRGRLGMMLGTWNPAFLATKDMLELMNKEIFGDVDFRDWMFAFKFSLFANISSGMGREILAAIIDDLVIAASEDMRLGEGIPDELLAPAAESVVMPQELQADLASSDHVRAALTGNSWLVVIYLALAFLDLEHPLIDPPAAKASPRV